MTASKTPHLIVDDFLPSADAARLLAQVLSAEPQFFAAQIIDGTSLRQDRSVRSSLRLPNQHDVDLAPLKAAVMQQSSALFAATGVTPFAVHSLECSIVAHGDGDFYRRHIDTVTGEDGSRASHYRALSCVYYLHREPRCFSGGALAIHPIGPIGGTEVEPLHNRLLAFPAFVPHEVLPISCPGNAFSDRRFSVNCWLHRARDN